MPAEENAIFISYRRSDSNDVTGRICDRLKAHFGPKAIFIDYDDIPYGTDFPDHLQQTVDGAKVLLAIIGLTWLEVLKERMNQPKKDWVRSEIERALSQELWVIPVLVNGAQVPDKDELPVGLQALPRKNVAKARAGVDFDIDLQRLIVQLEKKCGVSVVNVDAMEWSGERLEAFQSALMSGYPKEADLKRLVRTSLDIRLNTVAGGENYSEIVFSLLESLEPEGDKLLTLAVAAQRKKPGNLKLRSFVATLPGVVPCR